VHGDLNLEKDIDKIEPKASRESSPDREPSSSTVPITKEPDITATAAPCSNSEDILEVIKRGRHASRASALSVDSQQTEADDEAHDHQVPPHRSRSRAHSSARSVRRDAIKVPVSERRGALARFCIFAEVTDPYDYTRPKKWTITFIIACAGAAAPMGSSLILPALRDIEATFRVTETVVNLSIAFYMLSMSIFPLWWSSFSETLGRRNIYLTSFVLYVVFNVLAGISTDIAMFIVMRCLSGGAAASVQAVGAGTVADIWEVKERGRAMGIFYLGPLCGPLLSPIIGGGLAESLGWRSTQYFLAIFGACLCTFILFCLPETLRRRKPLAAQAEQDAAAAIADIEDEKGGTSRPDLTRTATRQSVVQVKTRKYWLMLRRAFIDPLRIVLYLQFPAVAISVYYATVTFASLYMLNISVQMTFSVAPYNYGSTIIGLLYLPNSLGYFLSSILGGRWVDRIMAREARKAGRYDENGRLKYRPEDRMKENAWIGAIMWPAAIVTYGWTANYGVNIAGPMIANFFFGVGSMLIFAMATTMLTEFMPRKASNGVALNNFVRNIFSCVACIVTSPLINAIGNGITFTIVGAVALISGVFTIWAMKRYGDHWRIGMDERMEKAMGD
jgi:MFS family permease